MFDFAKLFGRRHTPESVALDLLAGIRDGTVDLGLPPGEPTEAPPAPRSVYVEGVLLQSGEAVIEFPPSSSGVVHGLITHPRSGG